MPNNDYRNDFRYNSRYDSRCKLEIQETVEYVLGCNYGETIPFEKLANILKYNIEDETENKKFKTQMGRVKNFLIEYGYILKSVTNVGYYILKPKQISGFCYHTYIRRTQNLLEKSDRILGHIDTTELSDIRKQEKTEVEELNEQVYHNIGQTIINSNYEHNKETYNNLND